MKCRKCGSMMVKNGTQRRISKVRGRYRNQHYLCTECGTTKSVQIEEKKCLDA